MRLHVLICNRPLWHCSSHRHFFTPFLLSGTVGFDLCQSLWTSSLNRFFRKGARAKRKMDNGRASLRNEPKHTMTTHAHQQKACLTQVIDEFWWQHLLCLLRPPSWLFSSNHPPTSSKQSTARRQRARRTTTHQYQDSERSDPIRTTTHSPTSSQAAGASGAAHPSGRADRNTKQPVEEQIASGSVPVNEKTKAVDQR